MNRLVLVPLFSTMTCVAGIAAVSIDQTRVVSDTVGESDPTLESDLKLDLPPTQPDSESNEVSHSQACREEDATNGSLGTSVGTLVAVAPKSESDHASFTNDDFATIEKVDIHFHLHSANTDFVAMARRDRFCFLNIATQSDVAEVMKRKHETIFLQYRANPDRVAPVSSFSMDGWDEPDWQERTIRFLDDTFQKGAVGVKVWKNIGMVVRDKQGKLVMIDDPKLDPIIDHIESREIVLMAHLGEPKNCWLPLGEMTVNNDRKYFEKNPQYHMYLHPEMPSYQDQINARDRMLERHPKLRFLGAHLASLEWSVDELARFLDRFPNAVVGLAARLGQLQYQSQQDRNKVISFLVEYQDRVLYGTDTGVGAEADVPQKYEQTKARWLRDWRYFNTKEWVTVPELDEPVQGLSLPKTVVEKLYRINAQKLFPHSWGRIAQ